MHSFLRISGLLSCIWLLPALSYAEDLLIEGAWVNMPPPVSDTAAAYMTITNRSDHAVAIESISSDVSLTTEFHSMEMHGDMMHMNKMDDVQLQPKQSLAFEMGGNHLMLVDLKHVLKADDKVHFTLKTVAGETYTLEADVRDMRKHHMHDAEHSHQGH